MTSTIPFLSSEYILWIDLVVGFGDNSTSSSELSQVLLKITFTLLESKRGTFPSLVWDLVVENIQNLWVWFGLLMVTNSPLHLTANDEASNSAEEDISIKGTVSGEEAKEPNLNCHNYKYYL